MQQWADIRRRVLVEGVSKRQILRETGMHWRTLEKILANPEPPGYRAKAPRARPKLGPLPRPDLPDPRGGQGLPQEAAAHRQADLRPARGRGLRGRLHGREGGGPRPQADPPRGLRPADPPPRRGPGRLRLRPGQRRRPAPQGRLLRHGLAALRRPVRPGVRARVHRDLLGGPRPRLRLPRRGAAADHLRQQPRDGRQDRRPAAAAADPGLPPAEEPLPVRSPLLPGAAAQREGGGRGDGQVRPAQLLRAGARRSATSTS